jgi:hypothetical protein
VSLLYLWIGMCVLVHADRSAPLAAQAAATDGGAAWVLAVPVRRAPDAAPAAPPALPPGAERVAPLTIDTIVRRQPASGRADALRQTISRTADRIHIAAGTDREWLFERNLRDPRRVSASLIDHASQAIVLYEESDLRMVLVAGRMSWRLVSMRRCSLATRAREARTIGGIRFARYSTDGKGASTEEVWWSDEHLLPSRFTITDGGGSTRFSIDRVRAGADAAFLGPAHTRFPACRIFDLAN